MAVLAIPPADDQSLLPPNKYRASTFISDSHWRTPTGEVRITEVMPFGGAGASLMRRTTGLTGSVYAPISEVAAGSRHNGFQRRVTATRTERTFELLDQAVPALRRARFSINS